MSTLQWKKCRGGRTPDGKNEVVFKPLQASQIEKVKCNEAKTPFLIGWRDY
jgi:hypothetical protein